MLRPEQQKSFWLYHDGGPCLSLYDRDISQERVKVYFGVTYLSSWGMIVKIIQQIEKVTTTRLQLVVSATRKTVTFFNYQPVQFVSVFILVTQMIFETLQLALKQKGSFLVCQEAATRSVLQKKEFLKNLQISQVNTYVGVSF